MKCEKLKIVYTKWINVKFVILKKYPKNLIILCQRFFVHARAANFETFSKLETKWRIWNPSRMFPITYALTSSGMNYIAFQYNSIPHAATHYTANLFCLFFSNLFSTNTSSHILSQYTHNSKIMLEYRSFKMFFSYSVSVPTQIIELFFGGGGYFN